MIRLVEFAASQLFCFDAVNVQTQYFWNFFKQWREIKKCGRIPNFILFSYKKSPLTLTIGDACSYCFLKLWYWILKPQCLLTTSITLLMFLEMIHLPVTFMKILYHNFYCRFLHKHDFSFFPGSWIPFDAYDDNNQYLKQIEAIDIQPNFSTKQ